MPIWRVLISGTIFAQLWQNRIWVQGESFQEAEEICDQIDTGWVNHIKLFQHSGVKYLSISAQSFGEAVNTSFTKSINKTGGQTEETQGLSFSCGLIRFNSALAGRRGRGRYYVAGHRQGATQLGRFVQTELDLWAQQLAIISGNFLGDTPATGINLLIRGEEPNVHNTLVTQMQMTPIIRVQRRRNLGVGA